MHKDGTSYHNAMRYCLVYEANYSGVWTTSQTGDDFEFHHNVIANSRTAWIKDEAVHITIKYMIASFQII